MNNVGSRRYGWEPFRPAAGLRCALVMAGAALLLAGCGKGQGPASSAPPASAAPQASAPAAPVQVPPAATSVASAATTGSAAVTEAAAAASAAAAAQAKLAGMDTPALLAAAQQAYAQHRLVAPAGDNAMEYYEAMLEKDPGNQVARDALREIFPFSVPEVEKAIAQNDFDEADREIGVLAKADPTNYTLTLLRSKLDAQKKLLARQQQEAKQKAAQAAELAAAQQQAAQQAAQREAAEKAAAAKAAAEKEAAARQAAQQAAASQAAAAAPEPAEPKPAGETRSAKVVAPATPEYPMQAARNQVSGYAVVQFTVGSDGKVSDAHVVDSSPRRVFDSAAIDAVRKTKFEPALKDGEPVSSVMRRRINFQFGG